jgi:hypothetical protein
MKERKQDDFFFEWTEWEGEGGGVIKGNQILSCVELPSCRLFNVHKSNKRCEQTKARILYPQAEYAASLQYFRASSCGMVRLTKGSILSSKIHHSFQCHQTMARNSIIITMYTCILA